MARTVKPWHEANPTLYEEVRQLIMSHFPTLHVDLENDTVYIRGIFPIRDVTTLREIDRYLIEIALPRDYRNSVPVVREKGGRIPKTLDRHINWDGSACLFVRDERWKHYPEGATIIDFINGPVYQYFLNQTYFELTGEWLFGERGHGVNGVIEYYQEELGTDDPVVIVRCLQYLSKSKVKGHWDCFCGSRNKLRNCHYQRLTDLRSKIPPKTAQESLSQIKEAVYHALKTRSQNQSAAVE